METETSQQRRDRWFQACKDATAKANLARDRLLAINAMDRALRDMYSAYEGNSFSETINEKFSSFMQDYLERRPKLREAVVQYDEQAQKYLELLENDG